MDYSDLRPSIESLYSTSRVPTFSVPTILPRRSPRLFSYGTARTIIPTIRSRLYVTCFFRGEGGPRRVERRGLAGDTDRGMRNMAARAKRLHLFIVSARGRRQNVCLCARSRTPACVYVCVHAKPRNNDRDKVNE